MAYAGLVWNPNTNGFAPSDSNGQTGVIGYTASSPYYKPGTAFDSNTGKTLSPTGYNVSPVGQPGGAYTQSQPDSRLTELQKIQDPNPSQLDELRRLMASMYQGPSLTDQVNSAYGGVESALNDYQNSVMGGKDTFINSLVQPYEALRPGLQNAYDMGMNLNQQQMGQNQQQETNALSQARSLFNEMQQGLQQRFGGSGSTGEFANAFYGRELGRNTGQIMNTAGQNMQALHTQAQNLLSTFNNNIKELEAKKAAALSQAQQAFQDRLDQISQMKIQSAQQKAQLQLQALQQLRAEAQAAQQQYTQFQQQLYLQHQSAQQQLQQMSQQYAQTAQQPTQQTAYTNPSYSQIGGGVAPSYNQLISSGYTGTSKIDPNTGLPLSY